MDDDKLLENVRLAAGCGASPTMLLSAAMASTGATSVDEALDRLNQLRREIARIDRETPRPHAALAELEPELLEDPPVARMRLDVGDHELRGKLVFGELLGKKSFMQVAALAIAGIEINQSDAALLEDIGVLGAARRPADMAADGREADRRERWEPRRSSHGGDSEPLHRPDDRAPERWVHAVSGSRRERCPRKENGGVRPAKGAREG